MGKDCKFKPGEQVIAINTASSITHNSYSARVMARNSRVTVVGTWMFQGEYDHTGWGIYFRVDRDLTGFFKEEDFDHYDKFGVNLAILEEIL